MSDLTAPAPVPAGPMPFTRLLDEAMRLVRRHFRAIYVPMMIPFALLAAGMGAIQAMLMKNATNGAAPMEQLALTCGILVLYLPLIFLLMIGIMAIQKAAIDAAAGRPVDVKGAWGFAFRPPVLGTLLLQGLAYFGAALACFIPILYVAPLLSLVAPAMVVEGVYGGRALSRSAELTRYNPQNRFFETPLVKAFGLMVVTAVISYALVLLVVIPFKLPQIIDTVRQAASGQEPEVTKWYWTEIPSQIFQVLASVAVYIYSSFGYALLFFDARSRKEGSDLATEIDTVFGAGGPGGMSGPGTPAGEPGS